jgi:hypothetical protein
MPCHHLPSQASPTRALLVYAKPSQAKPKSLTRRHGMPYQGTDVLPSLARASQAWTDLQWLALPSQAKLGLAKACMAALCQAEPSKAKVPNSSVPRHGMSYQNIDVLPSLARASKACTDLQCHGLPSHAKLSLANACVSALCQAEPSKAKFIRAKAWYAIPRYRCVAKPRKS